MLINKNIYLKKTVKTLIIKKITIFCIGNFYFSEDSDLFLTEYGEIYRCITAQNEVQSCNSKVYLYAKYFYILD